MKFSVFVFLSPACSTSSSILETVESEYFLVTHILITPLVFMQPLTALSPGVNSRGIDSPVRADVSITALPSITLPSKGIFSPGFTIIISPRAYFFRFYFELFFRFVLYLPSPDVYS